MSLSLGRRHFLSSLTAAPLLAQPRRPVNYVVIVADDMGIGDLGCYGAADARTPHFNALANEGLRFTDWHTGSPVCSPSRAALLTGQYPQHCGIPEILFSKPGHQVHGLRKDQPTLPRELRQLGYRTAAIGKWHLGTTEESQPLAQGFQSFFGFYSGWIDYFSHRYYQLGGDAVFHDLWRNDQEVWEEPSYQTELFTREANHFLQQQSAATPFLLYVAYGAPHYPMMAPQKYLQRFPKSMDRDRRLHCAVIAALDDAVGEIRATLKAKGLDRDTCVFFMSDNGATHEIRADHAARPYEGGSNRPYRGWKGSLFEGGHRVPAIMTWPGTLTPRVVADTGAAMHLLPTFVRWSGGTVPAGTDGVDLSAALRDGAAPWPSGSLFWDYTGQTAVRSGKWKFLTAHREGLGMPLTKGPWLSDLSVDPGEQKNVAAAHPDMVATLTREVAQWRQQMGLPPLG